MPSAIETITEGVSKASSGVDVVHKIGVIAATSYIIGNVVGSGIFITPTEILRNTES
ncbi:Protein AAT-5 c, partial [Aphelenchoides avenae]